MENSLGVRLTVEESTQNVRFWRILPVALTAAFSRTPPVTGPTRERVPRVDGRFGKSSANDRYLRIGDMGNVSCRTGHCGRGDGPRIWAESAPTGGRPGKDPARFARPLVKAEMFKPLWVFGDRAGNIPAGGRGLALLPRGRLRTARVDSETPPLRRPEEPPFPRIKRGAAERRRPRWRHPSRSAMAGRAGARETNELVT